VLGERTGLVPRSMVPGPVLGEPTGLVPGP